MTDKLGTTTAAAAMAARDRIRELLGRNTKGKPMGETIETRTLLQELTTACQEANRTRVSGGEFGLLEALEFPLIDLSRAARHEMYRFQDALYEQLIKDDRFPGNTVRMIRCGPMGALGFYPHFAPQALMRLALRAGNPAEAITRFQRLIEMPSASGKTVYALWGVPMEKESQLTDKVTIMPIEQVPDSRQKRKIMNPSYIDFGLSANSALDFTPPQSALVVAHNIDPLFHDPESPEGETARDEFRETDELLSDITLVLTVVGSRVVLFATQWFTFDDSDLNDVLLGTISRNSLHEILPISPLTPSPILDSAEAQDIVRAYLRLDVASRNRVRVALRRFGQALRRHNPGDKAVELCTAFEALLGDGGNTEMTHKIAVRTARLIGGDDETRKKNHHIMKQAYKIRSSLVHTGGVNIKNASGTIEQAISICADIIKIIIRKGAIPNWQLFDIT